ncbi:hypothetical protein B0H19DRAFT_204213 [Mycena capillaripes]|nr:hypothetical protein B0H19DRAFT_204213 [Mycena capillaripes]
MNAPLTILSLPNELLVAIATAGQEGRVADLDTSFGFKTEWTLSHLSRRFRNVIVGAPALWTFIEVNLCAEGSVEISKLYLEHSQTCHISVTLKYPRRNFIELGPELEWSLPILSHIDRMWRLNMQLRMEPGDPLLDSLRRGLVAPNLQHLEIANDASEDTAPMFSLEVPKLTFVKIVGFNALLMPAWTTSLTHLELWSVEGKDDSFFVAIAEQCSLLVHLRIDMTESYPRSRFHIPSLKYLHISIVGDSSVLCDIVEFLDTPLLAEFIINGAHGDGTFALFNSTSLHSSFPALTSLCFISSHACDSADETVSFTISSPPVERFPALEFLTLINLCFTHNLVHEILRHPWPLLKTVTIRPNWDGPDVSFAIREAARSKRQHGLPLPKFRLSPELFSLVKDWEEDMVDVEMFDPYEVINFLC